MKPPSDEVELTRYSKVVVPQVTRVAARLRVRRLLRDADGKLHSTLKRQMRDKQLREALVENVARDMIKDAKRVRKSSAPTRSGPRGRSKA